VPARTETTPTDRESRATLARPEDPGVGERYGSRIGEAIAAIGAGQRHEPRPIIESLDGKDRQLSGATQDDTRVPHPWQRRRKARGDLKTQRRRLPEDGRGYQETDETCSGSFHALILSQPAVFQGKLGSFVSDEMVREGSTQARYNLNVTFDFVVLGSGIAGLTFALDVAALGTVALITKKNRSDSNTNWAQGGIAGVMAPDDDFALHIEDTLIAGAGLCKREAVEVLVKEGPARIQELIAFGTQFTREPDGDIALTREGGHSRRRILFAADLTGKEIERALLSQIHAHPSITVFEHHLAIDFAKSADDDTAVCGVYALDTSSGEIETYLASRAVFLATGGCGHVYAHTTNPSIATGDGFAMAFRAGAQVANMEFVQFHPTTLFHPAARSFLISEAVRGEGGILRDGAGRAFMEDYDKRGNLAPRDIVARAIDAECKKQNAPCMFLDVTHIDAAELQHRFPNIYARCLSYGIDMTREPIPVVPAAHYQCGGVVTDLFGRTSLPRLYASGEVTCTGVHGANRLASNSLLEGLVFSHRASRLFLEGGEQTPPLPEYVAPFRPYRGRVRTADTDALKARIQATMTKFVGIVRTDERLKQAEVALQVIADEVDDLYAMYRPTEDLLELRNLSLTAQLIVRSAQQRRESRGLHYNTDYPDPKDTENHDTILIKRKRTDFSVIS
jgi:L-aspartate oxidase